MAGGVGEDAGELPPGMVRLPDGERMPVAEFMARHGAELAAYPDAEIGLLIPAWEPSAATADLLKGVVNFATAILAAAVVRNPTALKGATAIASQVAGGALIRNLPSPERLIVVRVRDILMGVD